MGHYNFQLLKLSIMVAFLLEKAMSDKKEIGELIYKVSVDTSELDKLEEQLTRIKQLMQDVGVKPKSIPQLFSQSSGAFFIKDAFINSAELADLHMKANEQDIAITELKRVMETQHQAWSQAVRELNNRTWCSQK